MYIFVEIKVKYFRSLEFFLMWASFIYLQENNDGTKLGSS